MSEIKPFLPKSAIRRQEGLDALVAHYKAFMETPLANPIDARLPSWTWGHFRWFGLGRFMKFENTHDLGFSSKTLPLDMALQKKTLEELQALVLHFVLTNPGKSRSRYNEVLRALLVIELVLRKRSKSGVADFSSLKASDLENASNYILSSSDRGRDVAATPSSGRDVLVETGVVTSGAVKNWVDSARQKATSDYRSKTRSLDADNSSKLPNLKAVAATAEYFASQPWLTRGDSLIDFDEDQRNIVVSSVLAVLSLTPCRLQEVVKNLSVNCLVRQPESTVGEVLGINWYSDKTDMANVKWVPYTTSGIFEEVVEEAVARLKYLTDGARSLLRTWDSECPEYIEAEYLKAKRENRLPNGWPWFEPKLKLRYSDAMFVCFKHQMHLTNHTIDNRIQVITKSNFIDWLRTKKSKNNWTGEPSTLKGFFDRIGYEGLELQTDDYNSHAFRHMVNTSARLGGMSEFDVNMWSHRKQRGQGEVYNHTTGEQRRNLIVQGHHKAKELTPEERLEHINNGMPLTRKNLGMRFELIGNSYGGFTFNHPLGTCIHNYAEAPCMRSMDCAMCPENLHCKGDKRTLKNLSEELEKSNSFLEMAISNKDRRGVHRFTMRSEVLTSLVEILGENSPLADGDLVILSSQETPKAGLLERARLVAEQIKRNQAEIENGHEETKNKLGLTRSLPVLDEQSDNSEDASPESFDSVIDDLLFDFKDGD